MQVEWSKKRLLDAQQTRVCCGIRCNIKNCKLRNRTSLVADEKTNGYIFDSMRVSSFL